MPRYYTYVIASLPMLQFGTKPPFSYERFIQLCKEFIAPNEIAVLADLPGTIESSYRGQVKTTLDKWYEFDRDIRNELVKIRAVRKKIDASRYLRPDDGYVEPYITHMALRAHRSLSVIETEELLDQQRWNKLEEIAEGHFFDFDVLLVYALKLLILIRWERIRLANGQELLAGILKNQSESHSPTVSL